MKRSSIPSAALRYALLAIALTGLLPTTVWAAATGAGDAAEAVQDRVVVRGPAGEVRESDVELMASEGISDGQIGYFWATPDAVESMARSLYAQQLLASRLDEQTRERTAMELAADAAVKGPRYLQLLQARTLSNKWLEEQGAKAQPDQATAESFAEADYLAHPKKYTLPERIRVRHILIRTGDDGLEDDAALAEAEELLQQLQAGADFAELARANPGDPGSAANGGELQPFSRGQMVPEFERAAFALQEPGELAGPVKTEYGYHVLQLEERFPAQLLPFDDIKQELTEEVRQQFDAKERERIWQEAKDAGQVDEAVLKALVVRKSAQAAREGRLKYEGGSDFISGQGK